MKVMKPLAITKVNDTMYEYSGGYQTVSVAIDEAESADRYDGRNVVTIFWPDGTIDQKEALSDQELYAKIERRLLYPRERKFTLAEYDWAVERDGYIRGVVQLALGGLTYQTSFDGALIHALIDTEGGGTDGKRVIDFEIVGSEATTAIIMVTVGPYKR